MKRLFRLLSTAAIVCAAAAPAHAEQYFTGGIGAFNISADGHKNASIDFMGEWRGNAFFYDLKPIVGLEVNGDGGAYGYGGLLYDWQFAPNWYLEPSVAAGAYAHSDGEELGGWFEFREGIEVDYQFPQAYRAGLRFEHISNADIYSNNPGEQAVLATFSIPLGN